MCLNDCLSALTQQNYKLLPVLKTLKILTEHKGDKCVLHLAQ